MGGHRWQPFLFVSLLAHYRYSKRRIDNRPEPRSILRADGVARMPGDILYEQYFNEREQAARSGAEEKPKRCQLRVRFGFTFCRPSVVCITCSRPVANTTGKFQSRRRLPASAAAAASTSIKFNNAQSNSTQSTCTFDSGQPIYWVSRARFIPELFFFTCIDFHC